MTVILTQQKLLSKKIAVRQVNFNYCSHNKKLKKRLNFEFRNLLNTELKVMHARPCGFPTDKTSRRVKPQCSQSFVFKAPLALQQHLSDPKKKIQHVCIFSKRHECRKYTPKSIILVLIEKCYSDFFLYMTLYYQTLHVVDGGSSIRKEYVAQKL